MDIQTRDQEDRKVCMIQQNLQRASICLIEGRVCKYRRLGLHYWAEKFVSVVLVTALCLGAMMSASADGQKLCSAIEYLIEQSRSQFMAIREESAGNAGDYETVFVLPDASHCIVLVDLERSSYQCSGEFPYRDERAEATFKRFKNEMRNCIGHLAEEREDQSVNHPDFYLSYYYSLPSGQANVTLKNKVKMMRTFVSIGIDGLTKAK